MVVAAGIDAAGDLDLQIADVALALDIAETLGDFLRDRDRARIGQRAVVEARAGDDVGDQAGIGGRQPDVDQPAHRAPSDRPAPHAAGSGSAHG
jgi:hypothetical protein